MLGIALLVLFGSGLPILYRQERIGRNGRPFTLRKFRALKRRSATENSVAPEDDPRITRVGLPLRRTRLDELPQLYNVLVGDMSLVGPRPMVPRHLDALDRAVCEALLSVRPGVTDPASILYFAEDAVLATPQHCEAQPSEFQPPASIPARSAGTAYHTFLRLNSVNLPGTSQLFNNHIPLDPRLDGAVAVTKTTPMLNVTRGQLVPYSIRVSNSFGADLYDVNIVDRFPAGFRYVEGSARFDDVPSEPTIAGRDLTWSEIVLATDGTHEIKLLLAVGAGVTEGEFVNRAFAMNSLLGTAMSEEATATVRIIPDPTFDCTDVTGKVYDDYNLNGFQDDDETGLAGVRLVTTRGLAATTDASGRYHITCAILPNESRGSNFVLKLDDRSLPSGYRVTTRPVQVQRATRGKALRLNFGAAIHRVVGLDIADPAFEPDSIEMRRQWQPRISMLLEELQKAPSVLRLSYVADTETEDLVERRMAAIKDRIMTEWQTLNCCYELVIEPEVYWRLDGPPKQSMEVKQ